MDIDLSRAHVSRLALAPISSLDISLLPLNSFEQSQIHGLVLQPVLVLGRVPSSKLPRRQRDTLDVYRGAAGRTELVVLGAGSECVRCHGCWGG